jgi:poly(3-hydroxybutyrate) depolymerase
MRTSALLPLFLATSVVTLLVGACSGGAGDTTPGGGAGTGMTNTAGTTSTAGTTATAGTTGTAGTTATAGSTGTGGTGTAGSAAVAGSGGMSGGGAGGSGNAGGTAGGGGTGGGSATGTLGCKMNPPDTDSSTKWVKHDIEVSGVDPAFITQYPPNAGTTYNWTHRNYFLRLPTGYDSSKVYPVTIGSSGCGGPETVGSEGGYAPLGTSPGETQAIQVALSYVLSSAANSDCGGAVFADKFPNSPDVQYLAAVVKDVQAKYCSDAGKVFLSGYSSGAFESVQLGCANSDILRGYGVQIGGGLRVNGPKPCKGPIAAMFVVGLQDNENPIGPLASPLHDSTGTAPARDEVLKRNGCTDNTTAPWDPAYPDCVKYTSCPAKYPVVWCPIMSGHTPDAADPAIGKYRYEGLWKFWSTLP